MKFSIAAGPSSGLVNFVSAWRLAGSGPAEPPRRESGVRWLRDPHPSTAGVDEVGQAELLRLLKTVFSGGDNVFVPRRDSGLVSLS